MYHQALAAPVPSRARNALLLHKWERLKAGATVLTNDQELDAWSERFTKRDDADAGLFFRQLATKPNPQRLGTQDQCVAWLTHRP